MADDPWFAPKRYGYGAGLPIAWQGWAVLSGYAVLLLLLGILTKLPGTTPRAIAATLFVIITAAFIELCRRRTRGGWKWRWGGED